MKLLRIFLAALLTLSAFGSCAEAAEAASAAKVLFVYDKFGNGPNFYVDEFRKQLREKGNEVEETALDSSPVTDLSPYRFLIIYSRVMAFNMMSPVRGWIRAQKSFNGKELFIYVTADRLLNKTHRKGLLRLVKKRGGAVVDAVTMATHGMSEAQKREAIAKHLAKLK
jgi:DNA topoisomerase IB